MIAKAVPSTAETTSERSTTRPHRQAAAHSSVDGGAEASCVDRSVSSSMAGPDWCCMRPHTRLTMLGSVQTVQSLCGSSNQPANRLSSWQPLSSQTSPSLAHMNVAFRATMVAALQVYST